MVVAVMVAKRADGGSSFGSLGRYMSESVNLETGEVIERGEPYISDNLLSARTASAEMKAVAGENTRVKDPVLHMVISWPEGERPTREQWTAAVDTTVKQLGLEGHQFMAVAHEDTENFHVHIMANRVHEQSLKSWGAEWYKENLSNACREIEHTQGWRVENGLTRIDENGDRVRVSREERRQVREAEGRAEPLGLSQRAESMERYSNAESLEGYIGREVRPEINALMKRPEVTWMDVHAVMDKHGLEIVPAERGSGFVVRELGKGDAGLGVGASNALRAQFSGKAKAATLEKLGEWQPRPAYFDQAVKKEQRYTPSREVQGRSDGNAEARAKARQALQERYRAQTLDQRRALRETYSSERRRLSQAIHRDARDQRTRIKADEVAAKSRATTLATPGERRQARNEAHHRAMIERSRVAAELVKRRKEIHHEANAAALAKHGPVKDKRTWVAEQAAQGDAAAMSMHRGYLYQDKRIAKALEREAAARDGAGLYPSKAPTAFEVTPPQVAMEAMRANRAEKRERLAEHSYDLKTGHVTYTVNGQEAFTDQGKRLVMKNTMAERNGDAIEDMLHMASVKYGRDNVVLYGNDEFKRRAIEVAVERNVPVTFADKEQEALRQQLIAERHAARDLARDGVQQQTPAASEPTREKSNVERQREIIEAQRLRRQQENDQGKGPSR